MRTLNPSVVLCTRREADVGPLAASRDVFGARAEAMTAASCPWRRHSTPFAVAVVITVLCSVLNGTRPGG
jgi:hypothetical protein